MFINPETLVCKLFERKTRFLRGVAPAAIAVQILYGCAALDASKAEDTEQILAAAGFKMRLADTPEKLAHARELTQLKLVPHDKDNATVYVYADAENCRCVYAGDEAAYQSYQLLAIQKGIADDQRTAAVINENAAMNWGMWGGGGGTGMMWGTGW
jgi:hypothetical protein